MKIIALPFAILVFVAGCSEKNESPPLAVRIVKAMTVGVVDGYQVLSYGGDVRARHETLVGFRVGGKITEQIVDIGDAVKPGQVLAKIDATDFALSVSNADAQSALAEADAKRYRDLRQKNFVSQAAVDARDSAQKATKVQASLMRNQAAYATLTADRAGVVAEVLAQQGQVVAAGQPVFRMAWDAEREVAISIPEDAIADIKVGSKAKISLWSSRDKFYHGQVRELAPTADPATRTFAVRVSILDRALPKLGVSATVSFNTQSAAALSVPMTSVFQKGNQPAVWVIGKDNTLTLREVIVSSYGDGGVRIDKGLEAGERIVTAGVNRLHPGERVISAAEVR